MTRRFTGVLESPPRQEREHGADLVDAGVLVMGKHGGVGRRLDGRSAHAPPPSFSPTTGAPVASARSLLVRLAGGHFAERVTNEDPEAVSVGGYLPPLDRRQPLTTPSVSRSLVLDTEACSAVAGPRGSEGVPIEQPGDLLPSGCALRGIAALLGSAEPGGLPPCWLGGPRARRRRRPDWEVPPFRLSTEVDSSGARADALR
jgi:hypothetical protein